MIGRLVSKAGHSFSPLEHLGFLEERKELRRKIELLGLRTSFNT
jgi:hypothetical protein